jgi:hypothetical protein
MGGALSDCCSNEQLKVPSKLAALTNEEAHMVKIQNKLKVHLLSCEEIKGAFITCLHFNSLEEREFKETLALLGLIKDEKSSQVYSTFYSKLKVLQSGKECKKLELQSTLIALYLLSMSKSAVKARYIGKLFFDYGSNEPISTLEDDDSYGGAQRGDVGGAGE